MARRGLALVALHRGRLDEATQIAETTLREAASDQAGDDPEVLALSVLLAEIRLEAGDVAAARATLEQTIPRLVARYGEGGDRTLEARDTLSGVCWWLGDARCAISEAERALAGYSSIAGPADTRRLGAEGKYAGALLLVGRAGEAHERLRKAVDAGLPAHGARNRWVAALLIEQAYAYLHDDRADEAIGPLRRVLEPYDADPQANPVPRLLAERLLASALLSTGRVDEALTLIHAAADRSRAAFGAAHALSRGMLVERARALLQKGDAAHALADADQVLATMDTRTGSSWRDRFHLRITRARALAALGRGQDAMTERRALVRDVESIRATLDNSPSVRQAYLREWIPEYKQLAIDLASSGLGAEAFGISELARSRTLVESLASQRADRTAAHDPADASRLAALTGRIGVLDEAIQWAGDEARVALERERRRFADELSALRNDIAARDPRYAAYLRPPHADPAAAHAAMQDGDLFVSYTVHGGQLLVASLDRRGQLKTSVRTITGSLRDAIDGWRAMLRSAKRGAEPQPVWIDGQSVVFGIAKPGPSARRAVSADEVGALLANLLLAPVAHRIERARRIIVAPDPARALLPFDALPWPRAPLVSRMDVAYVQSFGVLVSLAAKLRTATTTAPPRRALVVGDPDYGSGSAPRGAGEGESDLAESRARREPSRLVWRRLPGTRVEARAVARLFPAPRLLLDAAASEESIVRLADSGELKRFDVLHFATHGRISPRPLASALVLAAPREGDPADGYLTAAEIARYDFTSRLIVLSACETANSDAIDGEGLLGFPYVLLASGNASTVLTLWPIEDEATAAFMPAVLAGVRAGLAPSRALATAKRAWIARFGRASADVWAGVLVYGL
jgi:CHAT domain-containing protein